MRIDLYATPQRVPADGHSASRIRIEVRDGANNFVADGTQVIVHTDLGLLRTTDADRRATVNARTQGGVTLVEAISDSVGSATISAQVMDSRNQTVVDFLPPGQVGEPEARVLDIKGGWVGYAPDLGLIEARDRAQVIFGRLVIEVGDIVQIDTNALTLKAQSVIVKRDGKELRGEDLFFDIAAKKGVLRAFGKDGVERIVFNAFSLAPSSQEYVPPQDAFRMAEGEAPTWMVASGISFFINEKICLRHAGLFIQGHKVFGFPPLWIIAMPGYNGASNSQVLGISSSGGLAVDMPFFYRVTDTATGAIKVQKGAGSGTVVARNGWTLALQEEYRTPRQCEGVFAIEGLPQSDWGVRWQDTRPLFGESQSSMNVSMPDHRDLYADASIYRFNTSHRFNFRTSAQVLRNYDATWAADADWLTNARRISGGLSYRVGTTIGIHRAQILDSNLSSQLKTVFENQIFGALDFVPWSLGPHTTLTPGLTNTYIWNTGNTRTNNLRGELALDWTFGSRCGATLTYAAEKPSGFAGANNLQKLLTLDFRADRNKWNTYWSGSRDFTNDNLYASASLDYYPKHDWRLGFTKTYYSFNKSSFNDLETTLARRFGEREIGVSYSTATGRIWLQLGGFGGLGG